MVDFLYSDFSGTDVMMRSQANTFMFSGLIFLAQQIARDRDGWGKWLRRNSLQTTITHTVMVKIACLLKKGGQLRTPVFHVYLLNTLLQ